MKLTREEVEAAGFWDAGICVECPRICAETEEPCPDCGEEVMTAAAVLKVLDAVVREDEL